jgi:hypothetical protein
MKYIYNITIKDTNNNIVETFNISTKNFIEAVKRGDNWCKDYMKELNTSDNSYTLNKKYNVFVDGIINLGNIL